MRRSPSIAANRLDREMYLVLEDFSNGAAWRETDEDRTDYRTLISDLLTGLIPAFGRSDSVLKAGAGVIHF